MASNFALIVAQVGGKDAVIEALPLAATGIAIVFTVLTLLAVTISLLPKVVDVVEPWLPQGGGHGHGHGGHAVAAGAVAATAAVTTGIASTAQAAPADASESSRVAAAIGAALHRQRSGE